MDFYQELLLTGLISVLIAFLIGKIASVAADDDDRESALASSAGPSAHGVTTHPTAEEEISRNSPPAPPFDVEPQRLDLEKEEIAEEFSPEGYFIEQKEGFARDDEAEEEVVGLGGANAVENEDASAVEEKVGLLLDGEDDWEGIERSELEKLFGVAAEFVASEKGGEAVSKLTDEAQLLLYGLHKVATEGPCYEPKPMTLMVSARSKWYTWQRLGNMNPEAAMEEYIGLLNNSIPGWMVQEPVEQAKGNGCKVPQAGEITQIDQQGGKSSSHSNIEPEKLVGDFCPVEETTDSVATGPKLFKEGLTKVFSRQQEWHSEVTSGRSFGVWISLLHVCLCANPAVFQSHYF